MNASVHQGLPLEATEQKVESNWQIQLTATNRQNLSKYRGLTETDRLNNHTLSMYLGDVCLSNCGHDEQACALRKLQGQKKGQVDDFGDEFAVIAECA